MGYSLFYMHSTNSRQGLGQVGQGEGQEDFQGHQISVIESILHNIKMTDDEEEGEQLKMSTWAEY